MIHFPLQSQTLPVWGASLLPYTAVLTPVSHLRFTLLEHFIQWLKTNHPTTHPHSRSLNDLLPHSHKMQIKPLSVAFKASLSGQPQTPFSASHDQVQGVYSLKAFYFSEAMLPSPPHQTSSCPPGAFPQLSRWNELLPPLRSPSACCQRGQAALKQCWRTGLN